jgi:hypothetical protein
VTGAPARRTALAAALAEHLDVQRLSSATDPSFVDGFVALSMAAERLQVDDAALALAAAEGDEASAMLARVLLAARSHALTAAAKDRAFAAEPVLESAAAHLRSLLDAASADDEESVVRWLASPRIGLEIGQIRNAQAATQPASLRSTLAQALNSFRGHAHRDRAMRAARALRAVVDALGSAEARLSAIVRVAIRAIATIDPAPGQEEHSAEIEAVTRAAEEADLIWDGAANPPHARDRLRSLMDSFSRTNAQRASWPVARPSFMAASHAPNDDVWSKAASAAPSFASIDEIAARVGAEPWEWPAPESPRTIVAPPMTFSASRLNAFVTCGRRWFYEYLCDAVEDRGSIHATYGKVVHEALEALHRDVREPASVDPRTVVDRLLREIDIAFGKARPDFASQFEYEVSRLQARRAAPRYVDWLVTQAVSAPMEIVEVESVNRLRAGGHDFIGYIDRVDRPVGGGAVTIFDYKTGRVPEDPRAYLESVRAGDESQLALYYFMRRARGDDVARVALVSIRDTHDDVRVLALDIVEDGAVAPPPRPGVAACSRAVLDASLAALVRRCDLLTRQGLEHFEVGDDPPCRFCVYLPSCRERPPESESIFVR